MQGQSDKTLLFDLNVVFVCNRLKK